MTKLPVMMNKLDIVVIVIRKATKEVIELNKGVSITAIIVKDHHSESEVMFTLAALNYNRSSQWRVNVIAIRNEYTFFYDMGLK